MKVEKLNRLQFPFELALPSFSDGAGHQLIQFFIKYLATIEQNDDHCLDFLLKSALGGSRHVTPDQQDSQFLPSDGIVGVGTTLHHNVAISTLHFRKLRFIKENDVVGQPLLSPPASERTVMSRSWRYLTDVDIFSFKSAHSQN
jgi:hypothetical protein